MTATSNLAQRRVEVPASTGRADGPHVSWSPELNANPSQYLAEFGSYSDIERCSRTLNYPELATNVHAFWTDTDVYFLVRLP